MELKKASLEGHLVDVISFEKLKENKELYTTTNTAAGIEVNTSTGESFVLPFKDKGSPINDKAGVYTVGNVGYLIKYPDKRYKNEYKPDVIDFNETETIQDFINKQEKVKDVEREILCTPNNIYKPPIRETDAPEMKALKQAITAKNIDIDKYADRFGENFPNDKRKLKDEKITLFLLKRMAECLDMNVDLIISDKNPNVPNPIGIPIKVSLTGNFEEVEGGN
jgi:hypothetical protein